MLTAASSTDKSSIVADRTMARCALSTKQLSLIAIALLLTACEGTWATPNQIHLDALTRSHITGIASAQIAGERLRGEGDVGSDVNVQFPTLKNGAGYVVAVERGTCAHRIRTVASFDLYPYPDPGNGLESSGHVDVPIHQLMKDGYALALIDRKTHAAVSCGDLQTDRPF
jgi:hypothetical protein